uniref:ATP-dependent RNA helicase TDRD9 n=1 Tax=Astyanax mexicanus TaxID=7994 RepID=A0A8B9JYZ3_ASTMX
MKPAITAEQITKWFTIGAQFANVRITDEPKKESRADSVSEGKGPDQSSPLKDQGGPRNRRAELPTGLGSPPPPLASYQYPALPITKNRQELISLIENNSVVIIRGATGSGKTTQLPQFILDYYNEKNACCNLVVTQPRKIGASSIARWVARERKCTLGSLVGYQVGLEKMATEHTRLIYMTTGVLLQKLVSAKSLTEFTHIFIDEVHERTEELDFLLLVVRKLLHSNSRYVKVILMSATINCAEFAEYFGTPVRTRINPAYVFEVEGAPYTVEEFYLDDIQNTLCLKVSVFVRLLYSWAGLYIEIFKHIRYASLPERGSVLVFLPGLAEIQYMQEALSKLVRKRLQVYPLHSTVTLEEQNGVFLVPVPGYRKIILSTNIAESSVTVPDVKYVIDFCLARHLVCDKETNYQSLCLTWASKTNCNQRRGRAGRVSKGFCYRLVTREFWNKEIPDYAVPEMLRSPLASIVLKVKILNMGDPRTLLSTALTPPNLTDIKRTILQLKEMGALSVSSSSFDGDLTFLGRVLANLPVDLHLGKLIVLGHVFGCMEECLIIENCIQIKRIREVTSVHPLHVQLCTELLHCKKPISFVTQPESLTAICAHYQSTNYRSPVQVVIAGAFYPNYFIQGALDEELASKELSGNDPRTTVLVRNLPPFAFLYYKQLQSLFRQCGQVKSIAFDGSRAYVEFYRSSLRGSGVLPEVSLSLLLSQQRLPLQLQVHPAEEVEARAKGRVVEVGHFWGFQADEASMEKQRQLTTAINQLRLRPVPVSLYPNLLCLAPFCDIHTDTEPENYYRAKILHILGTNVFFLDYGNTSRVPCDHLRELPADLLTPPFQAQEFVVARMAPSAQSMILGDQWSSQARNRFITLVSGHSLIVSLYSILHGVMRVDLYVSMETGDASVADLLVQEGHARYTEESFESQQSHDVLVGLYQDLKEGTFTPSSTSSSWQSRKDEEKQLIDALLLSFSKSSHSAPKCRVPVHGPSSPHKVAFHCMSGVTMCRSVSIERDSINSVLVNDHPQDSHERMLVAAFVSLSSSGSRILLKETTLMPHIHGLPALITMLFTPIMELRTDKERTCFTGALCGLGAKSSSEEGVLPEHDIELAFDVKFDVEDITEINALRGVMNKLTCEGLNGLLNLGQERISCLQDEARERLIRYCSLTRLSLIYKLMRCRHCDILNYVFFII